jgi:hypothetical protein
VHLRNRTFSGVVGLAGGVPITLLTSNAPDRFKFRVFGCTLFAKVIDKLRRKMGEKAFRGFMVEYPPNALGYRVYSLVTRRIITSVHVIFQESGSGFGVSTTINSLDH